jgi:hypothetical protein
MSVGKRMNFIFQRMLLVIIAVVCQFFSAYRHELMVKRSYRYILPVQFHSSFSKQTLSMVFKIHVIFNHMRPDPPPSLQDLKNKITVACRQLTKEQILAATYREVSRRLELC